MKVAIVGVGSMGGAIMQGLNNLTKYDLIALNPKTHALKSWPMNISLSWFLIHKAWSSCSPMSLS